MRPDNSHYLHLAQARRHQDLIDRAANAIRALDRRGEAVSFASVARCSGVSRSFLNKIPELATEIKRLRTGRSQAPRVPSGQRMSDTSKDARLGQLKEVNCKLREEVAWLREQNALLLGKLRNK